VVRRAVLAAALMLALVAPNALAQGAQNQLPNGTYYGYDWATNATFEATVKSGYIYSAEYFTQLFNGTPGQLIPGTTSSLFGNFAGSFSPNPSKGYPIASNGSWGIASDLPPGEGPTVPTICGDTKYNQKLVASWNCTFQGTSPVMSGNGQFSVQRTSTPGPANGVYAGQVTTSAVPGNPSAPWTGTTGSLTLTVSNSTVSGSALLAPVDPTTGLITAPPSVSVTYGPVAIPSETNSSTGNQQTITSIDQNGVFHLPSNPPGYTLIGAFVPAGITGLPSGGMLTGVVETSPPTFNNAGQANYGTALPGSFQINGASSLYRGK
jgi:hypothetical protein